MNKLRQFAAKTPFIDTHSHLVHPAPDMPPKTPSLAALLLSPTCLPTFLSAGLGLRAASDIVSGRADPEIAKRTVLNFLPLVDQTSALRAAVSGVSLCAGMPLGELNAQNYDNIERTLPSPGRDQWDGLAGKFNIEAVAQNLNSERGAELVSGGDRFYAKENNAENSPFFLIPTFDAHALLPHSVSTLKYACFLGCGLDTLCDYESFLERLLDYYTANYRVCGLKVSEQYFRRLDYKTSERENAKKLYLRGKDGFEERELLDYIAFFIFCLAEKRNLTIQLHTGMLWRDPDVSSLHPGDLCNTLRRFPRLRFDLLHLGFPYIGEAAAIALNAPNAYLNLSWLPLISESLTVDWLVRLIELIPLNKITFGTDVFDISTLCGTVDLIRGIAVSAARRFPGKEELIIRRLLHDNAAELYGMTAEGSV